MIFKKIVVKLALMCLITTIFSFTPFYGQTINYQSRIEDLISKLELAINDNDLEKELHIHHQLIETYVKNLDYSKAYVESIKLKDLITSNKSNSTAKKIMPKLYNRIAWLLGGQLLYKEAISYLEEARDAAKSMEMDSLRFDSECTISFYSHLLEDEKRAHSIAEKLMKEARQKNDSALESMVHNLYYILFKEEENYEKELYHIKKTVPANTRRSKAYRNTKIGTAFKDLKQLDSALYYTESALKEAILIDERQLQSNCYIQLRYIYEGLGDYKKALENYLKFQDIQSYAHSYQSGIQLGELKQNYNEEKRNLESQIATERIDNQRRIIWLTLGALIFLSASLIYIFKKLNIIRKQKDLIEIQKADAIRSEQYKEQFLANMSHEIRTPMHAISGMTNSLLRDSDPKKQQLYLEAMKTSSDNLLMLLDDILDLSKIESGKLILNRSNIDLRQVVSEVVKIFKFTADDKNIKFKIDIADDVPINAFVDAIRIRQILINLIGNAIKFTKEGSISINLKPINNRLQFMIKDTGMGIHQKRLESIFEYFEQGEHSKSQLFGGTGLGLSISKRLVELHDGRIWVESELDKGSIFYFDFPIEIDRADENKSTEIESFDLSLIQSTLNNLKFLIVDDDEFNIMVVKDDLEYYLKLCQIEIATNGVEAVELFKAQKFDIILMDVHMPELDGMSAISIIRDIENNEAMNPIPIVVMTANTVKSNIENYLKNGANEYLSKPYIPEEMLKKLYGLMTSAID